jgi:2-keto-4-pentenoate hydratase/2-oxohepta-3-ene-1,7-dioic acid hydratase in catechol pathway
MKLCTYTANGQTRTGIVVGDAVIDTGVPGTMIDLIREWDSLKAGLEAKASAGEGMALSSVKLEAPIQRPGKIFGATLNYHSHVEEGKKFGGGDAPSRPGFFTKAQTSINGPYDPIIITKGTKVPEEHVGHFPDKIKAIFAIAESSTDYEIELVAVIGRGGKHISRGDALGAVFGYCVGNEVTERTWQIASPQWSLGKSFDTHAPIGPWIVTADEVGDPQTLGMRCFVNGELRQDNSTSDMVFPVDAQIEHLSVGMTLEPGDLIFTGTPAGVGVANMPPKFLKPGDVVRCEIEKLGHIEGTMVAES